MPPRPIVTVDLMHLNMPAEPREPGTLRADVPKTFAGIFNQRVVVIPTGTYIDVPRGLRVEVQPHVAAQELGLEVFASAYTGPFKGEVVIKVLNRGVSNVRLKSGDVVGRMTIHKIQADFVMRAEVPDEPSAVQAVA